MSISLYHIAAEYQQILLNLVDEETGEINEAAMCRLNDLSVPLQDKCINTVRYMKGLEAEYKAIEAERKAMQSREQAFAKQIKNIKGFLLENMERTEISEISCPQFVIKLQKNPPAVDAYDERVIPDKYKKVHITFDVAQIKEDLKAGIAVPGARLVQGNSVRIK